MLAWLNQRPIGQQLLFLMMITIGSLTGIFIGFLVTDLQTEVEEAHAKIHRLADHTSALITRNFRQHQTLLAQVANLPEVQTLDRTACAPSLNALGNLKNEFQYLAVLDIQGQLICSYRPKPPPAKISAKLVALSHAQPNQALIASAAIYDEESAAWLTLLAYPVFQADSKEAKGLVMMALNLPKLSQEIFNEGDGEALVAVVDQHHMVVLRSKQEERFIGKLANATLRDAINNNFTEVMTTTSLDNVQYLGVVQAIPLTNWTVVAGLPKKLVFAEHERVVRASIFIGLPGLLLIMFFAWRVSRNIVAPISSLGATASKIAAGDRTIRAFTDGPPEIVTVAKQLNQILDLRDQNETSLSEAASFNRSILNSITAEIAVLDQHGIILMLNDAWYKVGKENIVGASKADSPTQIGSNYLQASLGSSLGSSIDNSPESLLAQEVNQGIRAVLSGQFPSYSVEYPCHAPDQHRWFYLSVTPFGHRQNGVVISHTDISERKLADLALSQNQELLNNIIDSTPSTIFAHDLEHRFTLLNDATARLFGLPKSAILGKRLSEFMPAETAARLEKTNEAILKNGETYFSEEVIAVNNGKPNRVMITSKFPLHDMHGNITGLAGVATDITEFQAANAALRERETQNLALINAIPDIIFINRRDGEYLTCRTNANNSLLIPEEDFLHKKVHEILPPEIAQLCMQGITTAIDSNSLQEVNYVLTLNGEVRHYEARIAPFGNDTALSIVRDVSAHKRAEFALLASLQEKLGLLNEVHHRVKNNLQIITSLLRLEASRCSAAETKLILSDMQNRIRAMALLHESLYRNGAHTSVDLNEYLQQLATQVFSATLIQPHAISLHLDLTTVRVSMDQATPCGLLVNELLTNCLNHAFPKERSGIVKLELKRTATPNEVCLCVSDNGIGLPDEMAQPSKKSLGLQLVHDLTRQLKGKLQSSNQGGTTFSIVFIAEAPNSGELENHALLKRAV